jgi:hypothetical protein
MVESDRPPPFFAYQPPMVHVIFRVLKLSELFNFLAILGYFDYLNLWGKCGRLFFPFIVCPLLLSPKSDKILCGLRNLLNVRF